MILIHSVILLLLFKIRSCQLQCVKETPNDTEFSINVTTHIKVESGDCIWIPYEVTFPKNKITAPYKKIWFKEEPQYTETVEVVTNAESETRDTFRIDGLPRGEYEYGFKLEWECNQTYIFPKRVRISVSAFTKKPDVILPVAPMKEGQFAVLQCYAPRFCSGRANVYWKGANTNDFPDYDMYDRWYHTERGGDRYRDRFRYGYKGRSRLTLMPTADHHNTNITCVAESGDIIVETTVTLTVKFAPRILIASQCLVDGKLLVCVCISRGNPLSPITWPLASLTDFSVSSSSSIQTVNSTITMSAADYHNTTVKCISTNELGQTETEIPVQNSTENLMPRPSNPKSDAVLPGIIAGVSMSLNVVLLTILIIYYKRGKSQQKEPGEETNTYASLNLADVTSVYSVISPQTRQIA